MRSIDTFNQQFDATIAELATAVRALEDVAAIKLETAANFARFVLKPKTANACPLELIVHRNQTFDVMIATESYEALPIANWALFRELLDAVVAGHVVTESEVSTVTGLPVRISTNVRLREASIWSRSRTINTTPGSSQDDRTIRARSFIPYRR